MSNVLSSEGRSKVDFDYAKLRKTTNFIEPGMRHRERTRENMVSMRYLTFV